MPIVKNGSLIHEVYFEGNKRNNFEAIYSIKKSVTSASTGMAIEPGFIRDVETPILNLFTQYDIQDIKKQVKS